MSLLESRLRVWLVFSTTKLNEKKFVITSTDKKIALTRDVLTGSSYSDTTDSELVHLLS